jgi:hypothetical protein
MKLPQSRADAAQRFPHDPAFDIQCEPGLAINSYQGPVGQVLNFSQTEDLAAKNPDKFREMKQMFIAEAKKYQVFPMDASVAARIIAPRPNITAGRSEFVYTRPMTGLPQGDSPLLLNTSYTITADIEVPAGGAEGMILTSGGRFAGYGFYLLHGKPVFVWNLIDLERIKWKGPRRCRPAGTRSSSTSSTMASASVRSSTTTSAASPSPAPAR